MDVNANDTNIKYLLGRMYIFQKLRKTKRGAIFPRYNLNMLVFLTKRFKNDSLIV